MDRATTWPEDEHNENKASLSEWKDAAVALAAFSTSAGGAVCFGVSPQGKRIGVSIGANTLENLANDIRRNTDPPVFPSITVQDGDGPPLVIARAEECPIKPVWAFGRPYKRVGRTNSRCRVPRHCGWLRQRPATPGMLSTCHDRGLPRPEFRYEMGTFMVILRSAPAEPRPVVTPVPSELNARQRRALDHVRAHGSISPAEYREMVGASDRQARRDLAELVQRGLLQRTGHGRATWYMLGPPA